MDKDKIMMDLQEIFRDNFDDDDIVLTRETNADDIEEWDSLEQINLLTATERKYGIKFNLGDVRNLQNVGDLVDLLVKLMP